jgi:hypothetical protein
MDIRLYDKRLDDKFRHLCIARFPHATSAISTGCKINIITSRFVHLSRVISVVDNFQQEMARVMFDFARRGYSMQPLWNKLRHLLRKRLVYRPMFWHVHYRAIMGFYHQAMAPPPPPPWPPPLPPAQLSPSDMDTSA